MSVLFLILKFHPDDKILACNTQGQIHTIDRSSEKIKTYSLTDEFQSACLTSLNITDIPNQLALTSNDGCLILIDNKQEKVIQSSKHHNFEAWCALPMDKSSILTGSDDSTIKLYDTRTNLSKLCYRANAGVTCLHKPEKFENNLFLAGSYDSNIYLLDLRQPKLPLSSFEIPNEGGVWQLVSRHVDNSLEIICAGMYSGVHKILLEKQCFTLQNSFENYSKGISYGVDFYKEHYVMCSFYEKKVAIFDFI